MPILQRAVSHKSQEVSEVAKKLLEKIGDGEDPVKSANARQMVRAVEVLEQIGTAEAKALLKQLQHRGNSLMLRLEASQAFRRME